MKQATTNSASVYRNLSEEFLADEGCYILEISNHPDDPAASLARARVEVGKTTAWHYLRDTVERYIILQGSGYVEVGNESAEVAIGDVVIIPAGVRQRIKNTGDDELIFNCICTPRFRPENYQTLTDTPS